MKHKGCKIDGILLLDKPTGMTSNRVLQEVKRLYNAAKAGHTGSLDPLATGMLPICFGQATKLSQYLLDSDKCYMATMRLGEITDTGDSEGEVIKRASVPTMSAEVVKNVLAEFVGEIEQIPPMYSALKHNGQPLYKLARAGKKIERVARRVKIYDLTLEELTSDTITIKVTCSKGTYIRTLAEDISLKLPGACGAHLIALRRLYCAGFANDKMVTLNELIASAALGFESLNEKLLPVARALPNWQDLMVKDNELKRLLFGHKIQVDSQDGDFKLICNDKFVGIATVAGETIINRKLLI